MYNEAQFIDSLPDNIRGKVDLFGEMTVTISNIMTVLGISLEAQEVEEVEEKEQVNNTINSSTSSDPASESNLGFILTLIGASTITLGDLVSAGGVALDIKQSELNEKKEEYNQQEQNKLLNKIENQFSFLQNDMNNLFLLFDSLKNEVIYIQNNHDFFIPSPADK